MMRSIILYCLLPFCINGQKLINGPMIGHCAMREVTIWAQTDQPCDVHAKFWAATDATNTMSTQKVRTSHEHGYTAHLIAENLEPGITYNYEIYLNDSKQKVNHEQKFTTQKIWKWRTNAPDFKFTAGSCLYINEKQYDRPGTPYGGDYQILTAMGKENQDFMLWLGDNTYLREVDWDSKSGIYHRYTHTRNVGEMRSMLAKTPNYAIWDDHEYGPNDANWTYHGKHWTLQAFKDFWANPVYGAGHTEGTTGVFSWYDADFFLLDNRWYRSMSKPDGTMIGEQQFNWLIDALETSEARFKFVCIGSQVLNTHAHGENYSAFTNEWNKLLQTLDEKKIKNVIFLTGDRHHSEVSKWQGKNITLYDITTSPLTSGVGSNRNEFNKNRVDGSLVVKRNYSVIEIFGDKNDRKLKVTFKDKDGLALYSLEIK